MQGSRKQQSGGVSWTDLIFVGLNSKVIALERTSGEIQWTWKAPKGRGFVTLFLDGDQLMVGVSGYIYCLDPANGAAFWQNPLKGQGTGFVSLASLRGGSSAAIQAALTAQQQAQAAGAAGATTAST